MREKSDKTSREARILIFGLAIFICVFLGPFETSVDLGLWDRVTFWTISIVAVGFSIEFCVTTTLDSNWLKRLHVLLKLLIGAMIGAVPGAAFMIIINMIMRPQRLVGSDFPMTWFQVTILAMLIVGMEHLIWVRLNGPGTKLSRTETEMEPDTQQASEPVETIARARLFSRLPNSLREAQLISMSMQDHYVEINTTLGSEMLLMRLSDAIDLLDGLEGAQTHRSHWAAKLHSVSMSKVGRRHELLLSNGQKLPVSNSFKDDVERMLNEKGQA
ncbi:LytTR family DNA-binding domain-containing protein [Planktotalea sp.]|uniref:LytTR family DNA-binding domain-containing protein n=1 Tax=Planktotalea sp. TaxID=2029877 RepID=UPI003D6B3797